MKRTENEEKVVLTAEQMDLLASALQDAIGFQNAQASAAHMRGDTVAALDAADMADAYQALLAHAPSVTRVAVTVQHAPLARLYGEVGN